jgi:hypothetical protein
VRRREFLGTVARGAGAIGTVPAVARAAVARSTLRPRAGEFRTLDGTANNLRHRRWGAVGSRYRRLTPPRYADAIGQMVSGPNPRYVSNRIFNSLGVDLFSERNVSQLAWVWGQSLDHTFGFAKGGGESAPIPCSARDPMERYVSGLGAIPFTRDAMAAGSGYGRGRAREQINTVNAYIDASLVYGPSRERLRWIRAGTTEDGARERLGAELLLPGGYLPAATSRGDAAHAPAMQIEGMLRAAPDTAFEAGDVRANENSELTAIHTLLAREHNLIVGQLPRRLSPEERFQIARRVVGAIQQHITYEEFLPALGVRLSPYRGYDPRACSQLYGEFAAVGYRVHSMVNGEVHVVVGRGRYSEAEVAKLTSLGVTFGFLPGPRPQRLTLRISQSIAFFNPALLPAVGLGTMLLSLASEPGYRNDEQIDETLRSVLFEQPGSTGVVDLGAIDIQRGRDHGIPAYNDLRRALGLPARRSFMEITGEATEVFGRGFGADPINNPAILAWRSLHDLRGRSVAILDKTRRPIRGVRASTVAARLRAIYGSVERVDAFVGMVCERHVPGTEFGELQLELWRRQFEALRDGDRFFYRADPELERIRRAYGIDHRVSFADLIARNTGVHRTDLSDTVFFAPPPELATPLGANAT